MIFLNSKFHEIRQLGGCFHPQESQGEGDERHFGSNFFSELLKPFLIQQIFPKIKNNKVWETGMGHFLPKEEVGVANQWF